MAKENEKVAFPSRESLRLELLKLTYAHGRDSSEAVFRAKQLEDYVLESKSEEKKKTGNAKSQ